MKNCKTISDLNKKIINCKKCQRLVEFRNKIALEKRKQYKQEKYWGKPITGYGDLKARLLFIGLAPAAHGGNSTGKSCECGTGHGHKKSRKEKLDSIVELLRYIQDTVKSEPHLDEPIILDRCRKEKSYGLENINDMSKLKDFISNAVSTGRPVSVKLEYVPQEPISSSESMFDDTADYYQHGLVGAE